MGPRLRDISVWPPTWLLLSKTGPPLSPFLYYKNQINATLKSEVHNNTLCRWDNDTLRFSDKNQKAVDLLRTRCLKLKCLVLSDGRLYEIMRGNFERADRRSVIREVSQWRGEGRNN